MYIVVAGTLPFSPNANLVSLLYYFALPTTQGQAPHATEAVRLSISYLFVSKYTIQPVLLTKQSNPQD